MDLGLSILRITCRQGDLGSWGLINFKIIRYLVFFLLYFYYDFSFFFVLGLLQDLLLSRIKTVPTKRTGVLQKLKNKLSLGTTDIWGPLLSAREVWGFDTKKNF